MEQSVLSAEPRLPFPACSARPRQRGVNRPYYFQRLAPLPKITAPRKPSDAQLINSPSRDPPKSFVTNTMKADRRQSRRCKGRRMLIGFYELASTTITAGVNKIFVSQRPLGDCSIILRTFPSFTPALLHVMDVFPEREQRLISKGRHNQLL